MDIVIVILVTALHLYPTMTISTNHVRAVSNQDYYQNNPLPPDKTNWKIGLKEATYQALLREQIPDPGLKAGIYSAQIEGFQDTATPFGDIAVIARGQLYASSHGYQFVQDHYQNDCDDCHNTPHRCDRRHCQVSTNTNLDNLLALWTVKRIRHRDPKFGHRYELQFTISPMSPAASPHFVARNGQFDYSIPGHVFIVKLKENSVVQTQAKNSFKFDKEHKSTNQKEYKILPWSHDRINNNNNGDIFNHNIRNQGQIYQQNTPNSIVLNTGEYYIQKEKAAATTEQHIYNPGFLIGISPNGYKHIIHDIPGLERPYTEPHRHYIPPPEPTKQPMKHYHHHFYIPEVEDIDLDKKVTRPIPTTLTTTKNHQYLTTSYKTPEKIPTYFLTTAHNIPQTSTTPKHVYTSETTQSQVSPPLTTDQYYRTTYKYPDTSTFFNTHTHTETPHFVSDNPAYHPRTTLLQVYTIPDTSPTQQTPFNPSPYYIQYSEPDPLYSNNQPPTVPTYLTQTVHSTLQPTVPSFVTIQDLEHPKTATIYDYYDDIGLTQATTPTPVTRTTTRKKLKYPDSINAQLPPPDRGADTTVPYVASTAVTIISTSPSSVTETEAISVSTERSEEKESNVPEEKYNKNTESNESKATTIQEKIHSTIFDNEKLTTVDLKSRNKVKNTTPFVEVTSVFSTFVDDIQTTTDIPDSTTTITRKNDKDISDELFETVLIPARKPKPKEVYSEDFDIFGKTKKTTESTQTTEHITSKKGPNAFDEIFSDFKASTENTNRFLTPHTQLSINATDALKNVRISKYLKYKRNKPNRLSKFRHNEKQNKTESLAQTNTTDTKLSNVETKTSQSLITSISFKVNKNKKDNLENTSSQSVTPIIEERLTKGEIDEIHQNKTGFSIYEVQKPNTSTDRSQTFDDIAHTLVNHARIVSYFNTKTTKPTRRSYKVTNR